MSSHSPEATIIISSMSWSFSYVYSHMDVFSLALFPFNQEEHHTSYFILQVAIFTQ